ncbi:MAG: universal stress protein [Xanthomonadaceae bacterium]|nr:universal stress protein [Xanthomonadaceae bacterium]
MLRTIWALDPFEKQKVTDAVAKCASQWATITESLEPVYVLSPSEISLHMLESQEWLPQYEPAAKKALSAITKKLKLRGLKPAVILRDFKESLRGTVESLNEYARKQHADLILISTHARTGLSRFFIGSFTETLMTKAATSVLCVNPSAKSTPIKRILFSTDLSTQSIGTFPILLKLSKGLKAQIIIYHCIPMPLEPVLQSGVYLLGGGWVPFSNYIKTESTGRGEALKRLVDQAAEFGVKTQFILETKKPGIIDALLKASVKEKADCIALAVESSPVEATLLGSISRQIVRLSSKPVLLLKNKD